MDKQCGVRAYKATCDHCGSRWDKHVGCDRCLVGCFNPARHRNPFFGLKFPYQDQQQDWAYWWRDWCVGSPEWLCAECYDRMIEQAKQDEDFYRREDPNYVEDPEFTKVLEAL